MAKSRNPPQKEEKPHSWAAVRSLFTCKYLQVQQQQQLVQQQRQQDKFHKPQKLSEEDTSSAKCKKQGFKQEQTLEEVNKKCKKEQEINNKSKKLKCSGSLCSNTKVMHKPEISPPDEHKKRARLMASCNSESDASSRSMRNVSINVTSSSSSPSISGSFRNMPFRKLSGCYECRMVVDPVLGMTRDPSLRNSICSCPVCGEIFMKPENLELHQAVKHAGN